jgi:outer membrane immunogenic protein
MWTGFYVGLNAGGTWANSNNVTTTAVALPGTLWGTATSTPFGALFLGNGQEPALSASGVFGRGNNGGFIGGGQVGYNWQFYNHFVAGIEADIQGIAGSSGGGNAFSMAPAAGLVGSLGSNWVTTAQYRSNLDYLGTVRGRLGWLFTPTLLLYGTGGLAYGGVSVNNSFVTAHNTPFIPGFASFGSSAFSDTRVGWTAGGGLEWMFWPNWSAKVEYLYYDLGSVSTTALSVAPPVGPGGLNFWAFAAQTQQRFNGNIVRAGVNYHFNWGAPAPVVAKY